MSEPTFRLLHVDDDVQFIEVLASALGSLRPTWAIDSCVADASWLARWVDEIGDLLTGYDALLLDYHLDGCSAEVIIAAVRAAFDLAPPVIILSATDDDSCRRSCREAGAYAYLCKPADLQGMEPVLRAVESLADAAPRLPPPGEA